MCIYSYMSPSKYSPFDAIHLLRHFFHCSKLFLNLLILMPAIFLFVYLTSSMSLKRFPLRTFFIWGNKKNLFRVNQVNREGEAQGSCHFWSKTAQHRAVWAGVLVNHQFMSWNGQMPWECLQKKKSLKSNAVSYTTTS